MHTVTFYSYKGGVGRSLLVANCALYLAQLGLRVVTLDLDLEAPGLHYKLRGSLPEGFAPRRGVIDLIDDYATKGRLYDSLIDASFEVPMGDPILEPHEPAPRGWLRVIPAGAAPSMEYWRLVANIDWKRFLYDESATGIEFFLDLRDRIASEFNADLLLIDSRTGITEMGNVATSVLADMVVCIVVDNAENLDGSRAVLRGLRQHRRLSDEAPIEMKIAVSRPHASLPLSERLEKVRAFLNEPADMLETTLDVGPPYPLAYDPDVEQKERLVLAADLSQMAPLSLDYMALAEELVPESLWSGIRTAWAPRMQSPYPGNVWSYSRLALEQPGALVDGLYRVGRRCFIVIPGFNANVRADDGRGLSEWFDSENAMGAQIDIVGRVPDGAVRVPDPSLEDMVDLRDYPRNFRQVDTELCLRLPRTFPEFRTHGEGGASIIVEVERELRAEERATLRRELASLQYGPTIRKVIRVNAGVAGGEWRFRLPGIQGDIDLIPGHRLPSAFSRAVRDLVARDEDIWMTSRHAIHLGELDDPALVLPPWRGMPKARLLAGSGTLTVPGARRLLPFCAQLLITLPLSRDVDRDLADMGFTRQDLVTLAGEGRVILLLPQAVDRYEPALLNELARRAPESLVFSRALCAATMIELRRRLDPWFFPGFDLRERHERLHRASTREPEEESSPLFCLNPLLFSRFLSRVWARGEAHTHLKGAMASVYPGGGYGTLLAEQVQYDLGRELFRESTSAGAAVEQAAALGAAIVPMDRPESSLLGLTTLGADLLSSLSDTSNRTPAPLVLELPDERLSATELASLDGEELQDVRELISAVLGGSIWTNPTEPRIEAFHRWLRRAGARMKSSGKLTLSSPRRSLRSTAIGDTVPGKKRMRSMRYLRELVAGEHQSRLEVIKREPVIYLPSVVVGKVEA